MNKNYFPQVGSLVDRVIRHLASKGPNAYSSATDMSHSLGAPVSAFSACVISALNADVLSRHTANDPRGSVSYYLNEEQYKYATERMGMAGMNKMLPLPEGPDDKDKKIIEEIKAVWPVPPQSIEGDAQADEASDPGDGQPEEEPEEQEPVEPMTEPDPAPTESPAAASSEPVAQWRFRFVDEPAERSPFACALFNDGRLYMEVDGTNVMLKKEETQELLRYLDLMNQGQS